MTCTKCATALLPGSLFCHNCGHRVEAVGDSSSAKIVGEAEAIVVKLHGLYDDRRREELALALIPVLARIAKRIDMTNVEHIDLAALHSLLPLMEAQVNEGAPPIEVIGMNADVHRTLERAEFERFFLCLE